MSPLKKYIIFTLLFALLFSAAIAEAQVPNPRETPVVKVVRDASPAVVNISTEQLVKTAETEMFRNFLFRRPVEKYLPYSLGSGVIIDKDGHVLTNDHVVKQASRINVILADSRSFEANLVGADPSSDLAILKIETNEKLPFIKMGTSSDLMIGEPVVAIGNPFGLSHSITTGVISALNRSVTTGGLQYTDFIQTDAAINPGNSGGPLLNILGALIGINTAIRGDAEGIGFSIPIDRVKRIVDDLIVFGEVQTPWLGISVETVDSRIAKMFNFNGRGGLLVKQVAPNSPAAKIGLRNGDIITDIGKTGVATLNDLSTGLRIYDIGEKIPVQYWRDGRGLAIRAVGEVYPVETLVESINKFLGVQLVEKAAPKIGKAVVVGQTIRGGWASRLGLGAGDIILKLNGAEIDSMQSYLDALRRSRFHSTLTYIVASRRFIRRFTVETARINPTY